MTAHAFLAESFAKAFSALLPGGRVWSRDPDDVPSLLAVALGQVYERQSARALNLLTDAFPASTTELLGEWQESVGLPDPCAGDNPTLEQQRSQIVARLTDNGGSSAQYYISFAAALGYTITIDEFVPSRFGRKFGGKFGGDDWAYAWRVNLPTFTIAKLKFGDLFGKKFASWSDAVLQCELERIKPAHTVLIFNYES